MKTLLILFLVTVSYSVGAQVFSHQSIDNRSGVYSVVENPALLADSRLIFDINFLSLDAFIENDYASISPKDLLKPRISFDKPSVKKSNVNYNLNSQIELLGPSFMFSEGAGYSFAFFTRGRAMLSARDWDISMYDLLSRDIDVKQSVNIASKHTHTSAHIWGEAGVSYAQTIFSKGAHNLRSGISVKYLSGQGAGSMTIDDLAIQYQYDEAGENPRVSLDTKGSVSYTHSRLVDNLLNNSLGLKDLTFENMGWGVDFGLVYEWRPDHETYDEYDRDVNKYKLKVSASVMDIGSISYQNALGARYSLNKIIFQDEIAHNKSISENLDKFFDKTDNTKTLTYTLPTSLKISIDYKINNLFYLNLRTTQNVLSSSAVATPSTSYYSLTPRYEGRQYGVYMPISYYGISGWHMGLGARVGFIHFGSSTLVNNLLSRNKAIDVFVGITAPVGYYNTKDYNY